MAYYLKYKYLLCSSIIFYIVVIFLLILTASYEQESGEDFISLNLKQ